MNIEANDDGFGIPYNSDQNDWLSVKKKNKRSLVYNPQCDHTTLKFEIDMLFDNA